jgi:DNA-binding transcriptional ArsR family regulator
MKSRAYQPLTPQALAMVAAMFRTLGEPLRLRLLHSLQEGERPVGALAEELGTTQPNASKHLRLLFDAGLVARRQEKNTVYYMISDPMVFELCDVVCNRLAVRLGEQAEALPRRRRR